MVFGTFDMVHPGHRHFLKQARALAKHPYLIVSIARDKNVTRIKGQKPRHSETRRRGFLAPLTEVDKVLLGGVNDHLPHIIKARPDIIALGYDQSAYVGGLKTELTKAGLKTKVVRLRPYKPHLYKTSILQKK
jgi:FAD synthetase